MKILKILLFLIVFSLSAESGFSEVFPYSGDITGGAVGGDENWDTYADIVLPLVGSDESFFFLAPRATMTGKSIFESASHEFNIGAGYRAYFENIMKGGAIIGVNIYYDSRNSSINNNYQQAGIGLELLSKRIDFRANAYVPFANNDYYLGKSYNVFENNNIAAAYYYEVAMRGFDGEIGWNLPLPKCIGEFRIFAGYYHFVSDKTGSRYQGVKGKAEYRPVSILSLSASVFQNDYLTGSIWQAEAALSLPFSFVKMLQGKNPFGGVMKYVKTRQKAVKDRMGEIVRRDMYIRVYADNKKRFDDVVSDEDGYPYHFTVVSPEGNGDGTFKHPASLESGVDINKNVSGNNAVLLLLGGQYNLDNSLFLGGHAAKNILVTGPQEMANRGADLSPITSGNPVVNVSNGTTAFTIDSSATESFSVTSIEFEGASKTGTALEIVNKESSFYIGNNSFASFETSIKTESLSGSVYAFNNILKDNATAAALTGKDILFEQNIISGNTLHGIYVDSGEYIDIRLNRIESNGHGITLNNSRNSLVYQNELRNNVAAAVNSANSDEIIIHDNLIEDNEKDGIFWSGGTGGEISKNRIYNNLENGIKVLNSSDVYVVENEAVNNTSNGIYAFGSINFYVEANKVKLNKGSGFNITGSEGMAFYNNEISSNTGAGLYIENSVGADIENNILSFNEEDGVYAVNVSTSFFSGNISRSNEAAGMRFEGLFDSTVIKSTVQANKSHGMVFENVSDIQIVNNRSRENLSDGVYVDSGTFILIDANRVTANGGNGIYFKNVAVSTFNANIFEESGNIGGYFENVSDMLVQNGYFVDNRAEGVKFVNINGAYISGIASEENDKDGMYFENAFSAVVTNNIVDKNKQNGLHYISGSDMAFSGNSVYENVQIGIFVESGNGIRVLQNVIQNNSEGIRAVNSSSFTAHENSVSSNAAGGIYLSNIEVSTVSNNLVYENGGYGGIYASALLNMVLNNNSVSDNYSTGITLINVNNSTISDNQSDDNGGSGGMYIDTLSNSLLQNNSLHRSEGSGMALRNANNATLRYNGFYYNAAGGGLNISDSSGIIADTNFFQCYGTSAFYGLYLQGTVFFDGVSSGNNQFINSNYGKDGSSVSNYETDVMGKDNFY
jgi:parallel beta-helix repeat protein